LYNYIKKLSELYDKSKQEKYIRLKYDGWVVYSTNHSLERDVERVKLSKEEFDEILKKAIDFFKECDKCIKTTYLVYSRKKAQGLIVDLKDDNYFKIVTILPPKKQRISNKDYWKTQKIFVEKSENDLKEDLKIEYKEYLNDVKDIILI